MNCGSCKFSAEGMTCKAGILMDRYCPVKTARLNDNVRKGTHNDLGRKLRAALCS